MAYICQDEWELVRPTEFFPSPHAGNGRECDACGATVWHAARVTKAEAEQAKAEYERRVAAIADKHGLSHEETTNA